MDTVTAVDVRDWIARFIAWAEQHHEELTELDRRSGDGDYGTNLRSALRRTAAHLDAHTSDSPRAVFAGVADAFLNTGGTSGPLFGMWFRAFAEAIDAELTTAKLARAATEGLATVMRLGKAEVGHKTMVDAMAPAADALRHAAAQDYTLDEALRDAAAAAHAGAAATEDLVAQRGRASYLGDRARGVVDPGARTVAMFFESATDAEVQ
jgi:dihydroxyacetone kinase-like protein